MKISQKRLRLKHFRHKFSSVTSFSDLWETFRVPRAPNKTFRGSEHSKKIRALEFHQKWLRHLFNCFFIKNLKLVFLYYLEPIADEHFLKLNELWPVVVGQLPEQPFMTQEFLSSNPPIRKLFTLVYAKCIKRKKESWNDPFLDKFKAIFGHLNCLKLL